MKLLGITIDLSDIEKKAIKSEAVLQKLNVMKRQAMESLTGTSQPKQTYYM